MRVKFWTRAILSAAILILVGVPMSSLASSLDGHLKNLGNSIQAGDWKSAHASLQASVERFKELHSIATDITGPVAQIADELNRGLQVLDGQPVELELFVRLVEKDILILTSRNVNMPPFGDPMAVAQESALKSRDPEIRGSALDDIRREGENLREAYQKRLKQYNEERLQAQNLYAEAQNSVDHGLELEKTLLEINTGPAGSFLNLGGGKLTQTLLEVTLYLNPSLAERSNAAKSLLNKYDSTVTSMKSNLERYELFSQWVNFYRWQEWTRQHAPFSNEVQKAEDLLKSINDLENNRSSVPTPQAIKISQLIQRTVKETNVTIAEAAKLVQEANRRDAAAAADAEFRAMLSLGSAIGNGVSVSSASSTVKPASQSSPPVIIKNTTIIFNSYPPPPQFLEPQPSLPITQPD